MSDRRLVHLVDDEEAIRRSASFMLKTSGFDVKAWASGVEFLKEVRSLRPGCVLLDVRMPGLDGLEVQRRLIADGIALPVIIMTGHGDISIAVKAMKAGAVDFVEKPFQREVLLSAIAAAFDRLDGAATASRRAAEAETLIARLTARERDVLGGLAKGLPNKSIAFDLDISPRTVEVHRANMMAKLDVQSLSEALRIAFAAGLGASG